MSSKCATNQWLALPPYLRTQRSTNSHMPLYGAVKITRVNNGLHIVAQEILFLAGFEESPILAAP